MADETTPSLVWTTFWTTFWEENCHVCGQLESADYNG